MVVMAVIAGSRLCMSDSGRDGKLSRSTFQKLKDRAMTAAMNSKLSSTSFLDTSDTKVAKHALNSRPPYQVSSNIHAKFVWDSESVGLDRFEVKFVDCSFDKVGGMQSWARQNFGAHLGRFCRTASLEVSDP
eukprot:372037-Amphidinium_carterae.1